MTARQQRGEGHPSTAGPLGQQVFEIRLDVDGWTAHRHAIWAHQDVPGDIVAADWRPCDEVGVSHEGSGVVIGARQSRKVKRRCTCTHFTSHFSKKDEGGLEPATGSEVLEGIQDVFIPDILLTARQLVQEAATVCSPG